MNIIYYRESADSPWVGIPAIKGEQGEPYVLTEEDKAEIKEYIDEALGVIENGSY